jgi:predicted DNA-binding transcriptional regulator YafY
MRYDESLCYSAPIEFDRYKRGYVYTDPGFSINNIPVSEEDLQGLEMAIGLLEQFKNIPAIRVFEDAITKLAVAVKQNRQQQSEGSILILDRPKRYLGIEFMSDLVDAIRQKKVMRITYKPFTKMEAKKHTVHPYFIKEYQGRMYLIAKDIHPVKESKFLTFAFDRMAEVVTMSQVFTEEQVDRENYFRSAIGISLTDAQPERIVLRIDPQQANYLRLQPIHSSQQVLKDSPREFRIQLELVVNYELISLLLGMGDRVTVLEPASLAKKIHETAEAMCKNYRPDTKNQH